LGVCNFVFPWKLSELFSSAFPYTNTSSLPDIGEKHERRRFTVLFTIKSKGHNATSNLNQQPICSSKPLIKVKRRQQSFSLWSWFCEKTINLSAHPPVGFTSGQRQ
jgi:hypothetical protein